jgi:hypothetical protein
VESFTSIENTGRKRKHRIWANNIFLTIMVEVLELDLSLIFQKGLFMSYLRLNLNPSFPIPGVPHRHNDLYSVKLNITMEIRTLTR